VKDDKQVRLADKLNRILPYLNERQRRLMLATEAQAIGYGGVSAVAHATGASRATIHRGIEELRRARVSAWDVQDDLGQVRRVGGGRKSLAEHDPTLLKRLDSLVDPLTRGDPESPLRWTCKSTRDLAEALSMPGHPISHQSVGELLKLQGYSLQGNVKTQEGQQHPDRNAQFAYLNQQIVAFMERQQPVVSVDTKKKELVGAYKNRGREWERRKQPVRVKVHDFEDKDLGKAIPYGVYDIGRNEGWVSVGQDHDTASFAAASLMRWWRMLGQRHYPNADALLISADGGGSNGYRLRLWKVELQRFADETGLAVTVCHLPPGTRKWNKIEHRMFSQISVNWRGRPLISHEVIVSLIGATQTHTGLRVEAELDPAKYPTKVKVSDAELQQVNLHRHDFHGEWNYTIRPRR
jgi:hypothetical protein